MNNVKGNLVLIYPVFHPYAGMIRIRLEGIISAHNSGHPLKTGCKGKHNL